jgi:hypothetical protein
MSDIPMKAGCLAQLKPGFERVYPLSFPGAQVRVTDFTIDPEGFERVYVEWDKKHWRYNNEKDAWTYANHFEVIAPAPDTMAPKQESAERAPEEPSPVLEALKAQAAEDDDEIDNSVDEYRQVIENAFNAVIEGTGFILLTLSPGEDKKLITQLYSAALDATTNGILQRQVIKLAANILETYGR